MNFKAIKRWIAGAALAALCIQTASAQTMTVNLTDGSSHNYECSQIQSVKFEAAEAPFTLEATDITATSAVLKVTPDDNSVRYYYDLCTKVQFDQYGVEYIVNDAINNVQQSYPNLTLDQILEAALSQGPDQDEVRGLPVDTEMAFYAIAVNDAGKCYGPSAVIFFRTLAAGNPADCTFEITPSGVTSESVVMNIRPSDTSVKYWAGVYAANSWPGDFALTSEVESAIKEAAAEEGLPLDVTVGIITYSGTISELEYGLEASTTYYVYAYAMNNDGSAAGKVYKEVFTTPAFDISDADMRISYRYFDGTALAAAYPEKFANATGKAVVQVLANPNEIAAHYVWGLAAGDMTDQLAYPEDACKNAVLQGGFIDAPAKQLYVNYGDVTFFYYASDSYGIDGNFYRLLANFNPEDALEADKYTDLDDLVPTSAARMLKVAPAAAKTPTFSVFKKMRTARPQGFRAVEF